MNSIEAIQNTIQTADMVAQSYLNDLTDEEMMVRPHADCNHINWQVGHLIQSDHDMASGCIGDALPPLPDGFAEKYSKDHSKSDDASAFCSKAELMDVFQKQRQAILGELAKLSDADLDQPAPEAMQSYAPTWGAAFNMIGSHWMMHVGQWVVVRRILGREIIM